MRQYRQMKRSPNLSSATATQRYITKVRIENFQSHEDTEFDLSPGVNLIVGSSEAGKSAILRAINFALHNEPRGDDFVRMERDETRVHIWWSDGCYLCRIKGESRNAVLITDKDGYQQGFEKIGTSLPSEALKVLGYPPIDGESGPIAYADQHQPLFLVTLSASELPRTISRLTGIDDFEDAADALNKEANAANRKIKDSTKRLEKYDSDLKAFQGLDDKLKHLETMDELAEKIDDISNAVKSAKNLHSNYEGLMQMGRQANAALQAANKIAVLTSQLPALQLIETNIKNAAELKNSFDTLLMLESQAVTTLVESESISSQKNIDALAQIQTIQDGVKRAKNLKKEHDELIQKGRSVNIEITTKNDALKGLMTDRDTLVQEMKTAGLWCNVCQRPKSMDAC